MSVKQNHQHSGGAKITRTLALRTRARTCQRAFSVIASSRFEILACADCACVEYPGEASVPAPNFCMELLACELPVHASHQCDSDW
jgi:hypothetical protein